MSAMKRSALRFDILGLLAECGGNWLPETTLFAQLHSLLGRVVSELEMCDSLAWLKGKAYVDFTVEELTEQKRWRITDAGKALLPKRTPQF